MISTVQSSIVLGIKAHRVHVEVDVSNGLPMVGLVGLPDDLVSETRERVRSAIKNSGLAFPQDKRVSIHISDFIVPIKDEDYITSTSKTPSTVKRITKALSSEKRLARDQ